MTTTVRRRRGAGITATAGLLVVPALLTSCGSKWVQTQAVTADSPEAMTILVDYGSFCWSSPDPMPKATVVESDTEVRITPNVPAPHGDQKLCMTFEDIALAEPIGDRTVIDTRTGSAFTVTFGPPST